MRLSLVHGFTQTGRSWGPVADRLRAKGHDVVTPDAPGHGARSDTGSDLPAGARLLAAEVGPATWVGYSMGGRLALHVGLLCPEVVEGLVLVSTTAGLEDEAERRSRREADETLARRVEQIGVPAFVEQWLEGPLWATLSRDQTGIEHRLANTASGLASSLRLAGTGAHDPLWARLASIEVPALVVSGERDAKFGALGDRLAAALPHADRAVVPGAAHALPWEQPDVFADLVDGWVSQGGSRA